MTVEIAEGDADDAAAWSLLGAIFPSAKAVGFKSGTPISNPAEDRHLVAAVKRHFRVRDAGAGRVDRSRSELPFGGARQGFAELAVFYDPADEGLGVKVSLSVTRRTTLRGQGRARPFAGRTLAKVVNKAVSLTVMTEYRGGEAEAEKEKEEETAEASAASSVASAGERPGPEKSVGDASGLSQGLAQAGEGHSRPRAKPPGR